MNAHVLEQKAQHLILLWNYRRMIVYCSVMLKLESWIAIQVEVLVTERFKQAILCHSLVYWIMGLTTSGEDVICSSATWVVSTTWLRSSSGHIHSLSVSPVSFFWTKYVGSSSNCECCNWKVIVPYVSHCKFNFKFLVHVLLCDVVNANLIIYSFTTNFKKVLERVAVKHKLILNKNGWKHNIYVLPLLLGTKHCDPKFLVQLNILYVLIYLLR